MEFNELIKERRSVRAYRAAPTHEELVAILTDAQQAPSWKNSQTTRWYVVENPKKHEEMRPSAPMFGTLRDSQKGNRTMK